MKSSNSKVIILIIIILGYISFISISFAHKDKPYKQNINDKIEGDVIKENSTSSIKVRGGNC